MTGPVVPPGGEELREALGAELGRHRDVIELVDREGVPDGNGELFRYGCSCGHVRGTWTEREAMTRLKQSWQEHRAHVAAALAVVAEDQGRRRAAEELRRAGEDFRRTTLPGPWSSAEVAYEMDARAAALAPENARPE